MKHMPLVMALLMLAGCAPLYVAPTEGPIAKIFIPVDSTLRFGNSSGHIRIGVKQTEDCGYLNIYARPTKDGSEYRVFVIPAGKTIFVDVSYSNSIRYCTVRGSFISEQDHKYKVEAEYNGNQCSAGVVAISPENQKKDIVLTKAFLDQIAGEKICSNKESLFMAH